jgi:hypothetical protein
MTAAMRGAGMGDRNMPPYVHHDTTRYLHDRTVRIMRTATATVVVQYLDGAVWRYDTPTFWLTRTPAQFADIQQAYQTLGTPTPSAEDFL